MGKDLATLGIRVTTDGVQQADQQLKALEKSGARAETQTDKLGESLKTVGKGGTQGLREQKKALAELLGQIDPTVAALQRLDAQEKKLAKFRDKGLIDGAKFDELKTKLDQNRTSLSGFTAASDKTALSTKQLAFATRGLPAQFTDIATSIASGQRPMMVLLQQGGQLKDMFGGAGAAMKAMGTYVASLINPVTIAAAGIAVFGAAWLTADKQMRDAQNAITLAGAASGMTADQIRSVGAELGALNGGAGRATELMQELATSGQFTADQMKVVAEAALAMSQATGESADVTVNAFERIAGDPIKGLIDLNDKYHFLTEEVYLHVKALQDQGRQEEATTYAMQAASRALKTRANEVNENVNGMIQHWRNLKIIVGETWRAMVGAFQADGANAGYQRVIENANSSLRSLASNIQTAQKNGKVFNDQEIAQQKRTIEHYKKVKQQAAAAMANTPQARAAEKAANDQRIQDAKIAWREEGEAFTSKEEKKRREIAHTREAAKRAGVDEIELNKRLAQIEEKYADKTKSKKPKKANGRSAAAIEAIEGRNALQALKDETAARVSTITQAQKTLEASYKSGLINATDYYDALKKNAQESADAQVEGMQREIKALEARSNGAKATAQNEGKIAHLRAEIAKVQGETAEKQKRIDIEREGAIKKQTAQVEKYVATLDKQNAALRGEFEAKVAGIQMGQREYEIRSALAQITEDQANKQQALNEALDRGEANGGISLATYNAETAALQAATDERVAIVKQGYVDIDAAAGDWRNGMNAAFQDYAQSAKDVAGMTKDAFTNMFASTENALTQWITTGKADWKGLFDSILSDFVRMEVRILMSKALKYLNNGGDTGDAGASSGGGWLSAIMGAFSNKGGFGGGESLYGGGLATGGAAKAGMFYDVAEKGPELLQVGNRTILMMGRESGHVTPNDKLAAAKGGNQFTQVIHNNYAAPTDPRTQQQMAKQAGYETRRALARNA